MFNLGKIKELATKVEQLVSWLKAHETQIVALEKKVEELVKKFETKKKPPTK